MRPVQPTSVNMDADRIIEVIHVSVGVSSYYFPLRGAAQLANTRATDSSKPQCFKCEIIFMAYLEGISSSPFCQVTTSTHIHFVSRLVMAAGMM